MNVVLLGAGGMLARAVARASPTGVRLIAVTRAELDITDAAGVEAVLAMRPDWVINCAAWTRVDDAEEREVEVMRVNAEAVGIIGRAAATAGTRVLHMSTDYVFDGRLGRPYREGDLPSAQGVYGRSKLAGEKALVASGCQWTIVRSQWLYGGGPSFVRTMWTRARDGARARVVDDQLGAPTHVAELAGVIWRLVGEGADGTWHAAAGGCASWYQVACAVYTRLGADPALVTPCTTVEYGARAPRPADGRLDTGKLGGMRPFDVVLTEAMDPRRCGALGP